MSTRKTIFSTGEIYHIYNRSIRKTPIFIRENECKLFLESALYYLQPNPPIKFSIYIKNRQKYKVDLSKKLVTVICEGLMPNHFHLTLKQEEDNGIHNYLHRISTSYAHFFNLKYDLRGPVFENNFSAIMVETDEQLIHLSRYIHLNPVTSYLVEKPEDYLYSSYRHYLGLEKNPLIDSSLVMNFFSSTEKYMEFVNSRINYQRQLKDIEHLLLE